VGDSVAKSAAESGNRVKPQTLGTQVLEQIKDGTGVFHSAGIPVLPRSYGVRFVKHCDLVIVQEETFSKQSNRQSWYEHGTREGRVK
jgi:hypothetical protein